ncbi:Phytochrome-like protein cph1 [Variovorax sp. PBL-H6]|uniref:sensor histidine kinase n=1 Tax=Variovorax sp. PBL-H6 TaxID=434009 RepID=UPI0013197442|nr:ATP-binding protein [Variovorax sp. PBL-H6]VTU22687.1 Phytochrome-like protein cph1 [Variovorax sp. PBL-H6]
MNPDPHQRSAPAAGPDVLHDPAARLQEQARMERLASALDLSDDAVFLIDRASMTYLEVNQGASTLLGVTREALLKQRPNETSPSLGSLDDLGRLYDQVIAQAPLTQTSELLVQQSDGRTCICEARRKAIQQAGRWVIVATLRDISEQKRAMARMLEAEAEIRSKVEALTRSNQELEQFAYITSHDLSEPLRTVASYIQLLERRFAHQFDGDARDFMAYIVGGVQRMKALMDALLLYSRIGRRELVRQPVPLDRALDDALANLAPALRSSNATVHREPLPTVPGDKAEMTQVFQNLVGNALRYRTEGVAPLVSVSARDEGAEWIVEVRDNGIGIEPQYFQRIFMIFQKLHPRDHSEGTGIGLAICKKVVERHGGRISVASGPGQGATFAIHLPKPQPRTNS